MIIESGDNSISAMSRDPYFAAQHSIIILRYHTYHRRHPYYGVRSLPQMYVPIDRMIDIGSREEGGIRVISQILGQMMSPFSI